MDDTLERLRREHEATPADVEVARRYEAALLRAGDRQAARDLYRWKFQCPLSYVDDLTGDPWDPHVRRCDQCQKEVFYVTTPEALAEKVALSACVAIDPRLVDAGEVLIQAEQVHPAQEEGRPFCLLEVEAESIPMPTPILMGMIAEPFPGYGTPTPPPEPELDPPAARVPLLERALNLFRRHG